MTQKICEHWVSCGHKVTVITSRFNGSDEEEYIKGVRIIRGGSPNIHTSIFPTHLFAYWYYRTNLCGNVDCVIEEIHGAPYFTPLYVQEKKIALICELAGPMWDITVRYPWNKIGTFVEHAYPKYYSKTTVVTISESTENELADYAFNKRLIRLIHPGCDMQVITHPPVKEQDFTLLYLGRLSKAKGIEDAIHTVRLVQKEIPGVKLWIAGSGSDQYRKYLFDLCRTLNLTKTVIFFHFVPHTEKVKMLTRAHLLLSPSIREGWGLTVHEAGARMTPTIAYKSPGLQDVVRPGINGFITVRNTPESLAQIIRRVYRDPKLYRKLQEGAKKERNRYTWGQTCREWDNLINNV